MDDELFEDIVDIDASLGGSEKDEIDTEELIASSDEFSAQSTIETEDKNLDLSEDSIDTDELFESLDTSLANFEDDDVSSFNDLDEMDDDELFEDIDTSVGDSEKDKIDNDLGDINTDEILENINTSDVLSVYTIEKEKDEELPAKAGESSVFQEPVFYNDEVIDLAENTAADMQPSEVDALLEDIDALEERLSCVQENGEIVGLEQFETEPEFKEVDALSFNDSDTDEVTRLGNFASEIDDFELDAAETEQDLVIDSGVLSMIADDSSVILGEELADNIECLDDDIFASNDLNTEINEEIFEEEELPGIQSEIESGDVPVIFSNLSEALAQISESLSISFAQMLVAKDDSEELLEAAGQYTEYLQDFWTLAEENKLDGLGQICAFLNENIMGLSMQPQASRQAAQPIVEALPALMLDYLLLPPEGAVSLVKHLQDENWSAPLSAEDSNSLLQLLLLLPNISENKTDLSVSANEIEFNEDVLSELEIRQEQDAIVAPDIAQSFALAERLAPFSEILATAIDALSETLETLVTAEDESEELLEAASNYTEAMQPLADAAEQMQLQQLQIVFDFINENILALGMLPKAKRQSVQEQFATLPGLLLDYCLLPEEGANTLVAYLQESQWPVALPVEQVAELKSALLNISASKDSAVDYQMVSSSTEISVDVADIDLGNPTQIEILNAALLNAAEALSTALESFVSMDNSNELFFEALESYSTHLQDILDASEQAGLTGLQRVCTFINDNLIALSAEPPPKRQAVHEQLEQWPMLVLNYLTSPTESITPLVELLRNPQWLTPLSETQANELAATLRLGSVLSTSIEPENVAETATEISITEEEAEEVESEPIDAPEEGQISLGNSEMLEMLRGEIEGAKEDMAESLAKFCTLGNGDTAFAEATENYTELVGRLAMASEMVGLAGLQEVCEFINANVLELAAKDQAARAAAQPALEKWPVLVNAYLEAPASNIIALLNHLREDFWPSPLPDEKAHQLLNNLSQSSSGMGAEEEPEPSRATEAKPEDVVLTPPEDVNPDLLAAFLEEAPQNAADLSATLQRIIKEPVQEDVKLAQRIAHTLKGSANIIGIKGIASVAHHLEDILEYLFENAVPPPKPLTDTMIEAADTLEIMVESLLGKDDPPANAVGLLQEILDWANRIDNGQLNVSAEEIAKRKEEIAKATSVASKQAAPVAGAATQAAAAPGETEQSLRVPTRTIDELLRLVGEMSISIGQIQERLRQAMQSTKALNTQEILMQQKSYDLETMVDVQDVSGRARHRQIGGGAPVPKAELETTKSGFDSLEFEQYNELHSLTHSFIETIADSREVSTSILNDLTILDGMFIIQERLQKELQQIVMTTRMVPIKNIGARLERIVRQTCRATDKQAEFAVVGGDLLMDGDVLNKLTDPLLHILRNSVDHGLETPQERLAAGKPESGSVILNCFRQGNSIVVRCEDDGKGLNFDKIRSTAIERGLIKENQELTEKELGRLIFIAGFSTKGGVTQISGRGVGMDVVHTSILELKGSVDIDSITGQGTAISLTLPMSLVTEHVLLVSVGKERFALPTSHLTQALAADSGEFRRIGSKISFHMDKNAYPVTTLGELLNVTNVAPVSENETRPLVLVHEEGKTTAVLVDALLDSRDLVSKGMGKYVKKVRGVSGASILGDGSVVALLDLPELLRSPSQTLMSSMSVGEGEVSSGPVSVAGVPRIMIVDDSLSVRKSLSQLVEDEGYEAILAKDGLEAVELVGQKKPNVMLVDMEMPRMNGIELTAHIRANDATKSIPIFMITSRTTEKHRSLAKEAGVSRYLTKPYQNTELLGYIGEALKR